MNAHTKAILDQLDAHYGREYICYLNHENAWQLLIATMLSAQCTDARVNIVTKDLFVKYPSVEAFAEADLKELEQDIRPTGFYHNKAKNIIACCQRLMALHGGEVPSGLEELTALGIPVMPILGSTGLVGVLRGEAPVQRGRTLQRPDQPAAIEILSGLVPGDRLVTP